MLKVLVSEKKSLNKSAYKYSEPLLGRTNRGDRVLVIADVHYNRAKGYSQKYTIGYISNKQTTNSVALVRKRTIPTERPPLVGEVSVNF
jgi:hypothetical protein